jgi:hypothetical protein
MSKAKVATVAAILSLGTIVLGGAGAPAPAHAAARGEAVGASRDGVPPGFKVTMSGLDNPRGLAMSRDGAIYVTEAGHGGDAPCATMRGTTMCYGATGAVARLKKYIVTRVATGLPSYAPAGGNGATGPQRVCFDRVGRMFVTYGLGMNPAMRSTLGPGGARSGYLMRITGKGIPYPVADIAAFEAANNPAGGPVDSNPYGLVCNGGAELVTDAGGNSLFRVVKRSLSLLAVFPSRPARSTDSVPTSVVVGPGHAYYVGELSGAPFGVGSATVYRVVPGQPPQVYLTGFTTIIDMAFAADGSLYVLEHATGPVLSGAGALIRVSPNGTRTTVSDALNRPTAILIGRHGAVYVTNNGTSNSGGELLRLVG